MKHTPLFPVCLTIIVLLGLSSASFAAADCMTCHANAALTKQQGSSQKSLYVNAAVLQKSPHSILGCSDCHTDLSAANLPHAKNIQPVACTSCHPSPAKHAFHPELSKDPIVEKDLMVSCKDCHGKHDVVSPKNPENKFNPLHQAEACGACHPDVKDKYLKTDHAKNLGAEKNATPACTGCHQTKITASHWPSDPGSLKDEQDKACLACHDHNSQTAGKSLPAKTFFEAYENSVHAIARRAGNSNAANCVDCHGSHEMKKSGNAASNVNKTHITETCGKCHQDILTEYDQSVHATAFKDGVSTAPVCTSCHGEHNILGSADPKSRTAPQNISAQVCATCHESEKLALKYGIANNRFETFNDSYHGLATTGGDLTVANCASCHGSHGVKPSSDPASSINAANIVETCGKCHPSANERFTKGKVHIVMTAKESPLLFWISVIYFLLIVGTIGGMLVHNILHHVRYGIEHVRERRRQPGKEKLYMRMTVNERLQHATLVIVFTVLVITGFLLRYADSPLVLIVRDHFTNLFHTRAIVHRIAAVLFVAVGFYHLYYVAFTQRGRELITALLPRRKDLADVIGTFKYYLGKTPHKPKYDRFSYIEKAEYWALIWGSVVMNVTGIIMWFENTSMGVLTKLGYDISRLIHFYEAWLATLAIIVWHLFFVVFAPQVYPMSAVWLRGTLSEAEMEEEHPLELEEIKKKEKTEQPLG